MFIRFDMIHERDGRTDGRTDTHTSHRQKLTNFNVNWYETYFDGGHFAINITVFYTT